jgi:hypothetical protein
LGRAEGGLHLHLFRSEYCGLRGDRHHQQNYEGCYNRMTAQTRRLCSSSER